MKAFSGRQKKCGQCKKPFKPDRSFQPCCSVPCAILYARKQSEKEQKVIQKQRREGIKTRTEWLKDVQTAFNAWIRERDYGKPCISCGATTGQMQAGHYRSVGACPALRFNQLGCNVQCVRCNLHNSGNQIEYRKGLVKKIGLNLVEWLEQDHQPNKYTIDELKEMKRRYARMARELKKARA